MKVLDLIPDLPLPPGDNSASHLALCLTLRYLADHANYVELRNGEYLHDGHDCAAYLNEAADEIYAQVRREKIRVRA